MKKKLELFEKFDGAPINFKQASSGTTQLRIYVFCALLVFALLAILVRLFQLTVVKGSYYRFAAENNRIKEVSIEAPRGEIIDRYGFSLVTNREQQNEKQPFYRTYHLKDATAHLLGYRTLANKDDIAKDACKQPLGFTDRIGKSGIEQVFECQLRGKKGKTLFEVDAQGKLRKTLSSTDPIAGESLQLALDSSLQQKAYDFVNTQIITNSGGIVDLKEKKASIIVTKPKTGEILALISYPTFDPQAFEDNDQQKIATYFTSKDRPLFNRVLEGEYPPGSVFKLAVAAAALETKAIDKNTRIEDTGSIQAGPIKFGNWYFLKYGKTEGQVDLVKGLQRSNDIYFYRIGEKTTPQKIKVWAQNFGFGKKVDFPLDNKPGLIPSDFWKKETIGERWYLGDTFNLSIGQGYLLTTPLQVHMSASVFANEGKLCTPQLLKNAKPNCTKLQLAKETIELVQEGMKRACAPGGTGWPFFDFSVKDEKYVGSTDESAVSATASAGLRPISVACKTGTAESQKKSGIPHAWFTMYAPIENPEIAVTVMVEESGDGSNVAAPIAKEIVKNYFERTE